MRADAPSTITSVAMRPFRCTDDAPSDLLPRLRDDREADAARDRLLDLLADIFSDFRERRRRHDDRLHRLVDELTDLLEDARLRDDRVDELGLALRPQDLME